MARRISWYSTFDWGSLLWCAFVILIVGVLFSFRYWSDFIRHKKLEVYHGEALALVANIKANPILLQTQSGNDFSVYSYEISYSFTYNGAEYVGKDVVINTPVNRYGLKAILSGHSNVLTICFNKNYPEHSVIQLTN